MKMLTFQKRCAKEILRDPLNLCFGIGFPVILLILLNTINTNIPNDLFAIEYLAPGIAIFGLSFITLFSATLISKDRESSFLERLYTTPLTPLDFILGYMIPLLPIGLSQGVITYLLAIFLGLPIKINILFAILLMTPAVILYIMLGLFFGSILNVKQVGGICGALLTNLSAWLSGIWFDISLVGGAFERIARLLPFYHAVELQRAVINNNPSAILPSLFTVLLYAVIIGSFAVLLFLRQMKKQ